MAAGLSCHSSRKSGTKVRGILVLPCVEPDDQARLISAAAGHATLKQRLRHSSDRALTTAPRRTYRDRQWCRRTFVIDDQRQRVREHHKSKTIKLRIAQRHISHERNPPTTCAVASMPMLGGLRRHPYPCRGDPLTLKHPPQQLQPRRRQTERRIGRRLARCGAGDQSAPFAQTSARRSPPAQRSPQAKAKVAQVVGDVRRTRRLMA